MSMAFHPLMLLPLAAYFIGGIPFGFLAGKLKGVDLRRVGSGNIGATNAIRALGKPLGLAVFAADVLKGLLPVLLAGWAIYRREPIWVLDNPVLAEGVWAMTGVAAVLGHVFSPYLGFRGGKGVATTLGVALALWPWFTVSAALGLLTWLFVREFTRYVSVASVTASLCQPIFVTAALFATGERLNRHIPLIALATILALLSTWAHRGNISRLVRGKEPTIDQARASKDSKRAPTGRSHKTSTRHPARRSRASSSRR